MTTSQKPFTFDELVGAVESRLVKIEQVQEQAGHLRFSNWSWLLETERDQRLLKSRLIAMFSHDFRNPIAVIVSSANLIVDYGDRLPPENKAKKIQRIISSGFKLNQMLDDMLMVAEMEGESFRANPVDVYIPEVINEILDDFRVIHRETHNIKFTSEYDGFVSLDIKLLRQILSNLISNAAKYSDSGTDIRVSITEKQDHIDLSIRDYGIGIPESDLPNLFDPFHRANNVEDRKGTGLGLAIVKQAVELCDGNIEVESVVNKGTQFTVTLPK